MHLYALRVGRECGGAEGERMAEAACAAMGRERGAVAAELERAAAGSVPSAQPLRQRLGLKSPAKRGPLRAADLEEAGKAAISQIYVGIFKKLGISGLGAADAAQRPPTAAEFAEAAAAMVAIVRVRTGRGSGERRLFCLPWNAASPPLRHSGTHTFPFAVSARVAGALGAADPRAERHVRGRGGARDGFLHRRISLLLQRLCRRDVGLGRARRARGAGGVAARLAGLRLPPRPRADEAGVGVRLGLHAGGVARAVVPAWRGAGGGRVRCGAEGRGRGAADRGGERRRRGHAERAGRRAARGEMGGVVYAPSGLPRRLRRAGRAGGVAAAVGGPARVAERQRRAAGGPQERTRRVQGHGAVHQAGDAAFPAAGVLAAPAARGARRDAGAAGRHGRRGRVRGRGGVGGGAGVHTGHVRAARLRRLGGGGGADRGAAGRRRAGGALRGAADRPRPPAAGVRGDARAAGARGGAAGGARGGGGALAARGGGGDGGAHAPVRAAGGAGVWGRGGGEDGGGGVRGDGAGAGGGRGGAGARRCGVGAVSAAAAAAAGVEVAGQARTIAGGGPGGGGEGGDLTDLCGYIQEAGDQRLGRRGRRPTPPHGGGVRGGRGGHGCHCQGPYRERQRRAAPLLLAMERRVAPPAALGHSYISFCCVCACRRSTRCR